MDENETVTEQYPMMRMELLGIDIDLNLEENYGRIADDAFTPLAEHLLNKVVLRINHHRYRLTEIEFYLNDSAGRLDPYTHNHLDEGYQDGQLRLHNAGKGLDISLRNELDGVIYYGGVLIRSFQEVDEVGLALGEPYCGPSQLPRLITRSINYPEATTMDWVQMELPDTAEPIKILREGLLKNGNIDEIRGNEHKRQYLTKPWRYISQLPMVASSDDLKHGLIGQMNMPYEQLRNYCTGLEIGTYDHINEQFAIGAHMTLATLGQAELKGVDGKRQLLGFCFKNI